MSSKKTKSTKESKGSKKSPRKKSNEYELVAPECWINELARIDIEEKNWKCTVTIIEEETNDLAVYMEHFNDSATNGSRLSIKSISKLDVIQYVIKNMIESHPGVRVTPLSLLCSEIFRLVGPDFKSQIPTHLLASIIKYLIIEYKDLNKKIRSEMEQRKKDFEEYHKSLWQTPNMNTSSSKGNNSSKLEKKSDKVPKVTGNKPLTKLRKRGEEWKDKAWIDDSPPDGPQLYIAISTFFDPDLPLKLLQLNIPLHAIAKVSFWNDSRKRSDTSTSTIPADLKSVCQSLKHFRHKSTPHLQSSVLKKGSYASEMFENSTGRISSFWKRIDTLKNELPSALLFKDVMFLNFTPRHSLFEYHIKLFQEEIYKQISYFLYDVYAITKQHTQYISEINLKNVSETEPCNLSSMTVYKSLLDNVPHETVDIPFLLDALIIQTCSLENESDQRYGIQEFGITVETPIQTNIGNNLNKLLKQLNLSYDLCGKPLSFTASYAEQSNEFEDNCKIRHVLQHFDERHKKTFHLQEDISSFLRERTTRILNLAWNNILDNHYTSSNYDVNIVKLCNEIIETAEKNNQHLLKHYIYLLIVNKILNSLILHDLFDSTIKANSLKENILHSDKENLCQDCILELESNTFLRASFLRNSMSSTSSSNISTNSLSSEIIAFNLFYLEDMAADVMVQWIQKTWYSFNKVETRLCPFTNQVVMVFHNLLSPKVGVFEENWMGKLTTLVPIRDFVDYILEEEKDWFTEIQHDLMNESSNIDNKVGASFDAQLTYDLNFIFPENQFISQRSLKYETLLKTQNFEKQYKDLPTEKSKSSKKTTSKQPDSLKKPKKIETQKEKYVYEPVKTSVHSLKKVKEDFKFIGYELGEPKRFQFSGSRKEKVLDSCCKIELQTMNKLYSEKSQLLMVTISDHTLYYSFKPYCETNLNSPFHLILSSGIILYFGSSNEGIREKGQSILLPNAYKRTSTTETSLVKNTVLSTIMSHQHTVTISEAKKEFEGSNDFTPNMTKLSSCFPHSITNIPYFEIPLLYDLAISLPNGLHIELAKVDSLFYIRQKHLSRSVVKKRVEKEDFRCCLSNGYIIKFFSNNEMEILSANGEIFRVFAIKEEIVSSEIEEPLQYTEDTSAKTAFSDISFKKTKKGSLKTDETSKHSKVKKSSKSTNSIFSKKLSTINIDEQKPQAGLRNFTNRRTVFDYECTTTEGKRFKIQNNQSKEVFQDLLIIDTIDIENNCILSNRSDNVSMKHLADGSLSVQYTDGSRITSIPVEAGEVFCEWSSEELERWFSFSSEYINEFDDFEKAFLNESNTNLAKNSALSRQSENHLIGLETMNTDDMTKMEEKLQNDEETAHVSVLEEGRTKSYSNTTITKISSDLTTRQVEIYKKLSYQEDGFVVYHVSYLMEHPNYSAVYYNANTCDVELKLPINNSVVLKNDGCYQAHFDGATLTVDNEDIYFSKISESKDVERTVIINNSATANKTPVNFTNYHHNSLPLSVDEFCQSIGIKSIFRGMVEKTEIKSGLLLYCVDKISNEIIVDYDFNFHELPATKDEYLIPESSFTCAVINEDLSGFRLVTDYEVERYIQFITENQGLVKENNNEWKSLITTKPVFTNESEKWLSNYNESLIQKSKPAVELSTYGKKESWIQPFVTKSEKEQDLNAQEAVEIRILHKIPTEKTILDQLKSVLATFTKKTMKKEIKRVFLNEDRKDFTTDKFVRYPKLLCELITDEKNKKKKENDISRTAVELTFLRSLINKAIIKARKIRQKNKIKELKLALKRREVPPYYKSGFGYAHSILDEVIENITFDDKISLSLCSTCEKVNFIIDELLSVVTKKNHSESIATNRTINVMDDNDSGGIKSIISTIFRNACEESKENDVKSFINEVMEKPLKLITSEEIEFLNKMFGSGDCPMFEDEEFILQDVLNASHQLSNYFQNLRSMLEFHRGYFSSLPL